MKINFSLSLKLTLIVVIVSAALVFSLFFYNLSLQANFFIDDYVERGDTLAKSLDASIESGYELNDSQKIQIYFENVENLNPDLIEISFNLLDEKDELKVFVSTDKESIGNLSSLNNNIALSDFYNKNYSVGIIPRENIQMITVIAPVNLSGQLIGTYEMLFSMEKTYTTLNAHRNFLLLVSVISLFVLVFSFLFLLRRIIVKPIITFRDDSKLIGKGNLDVKIDIKSRDELGELALAFNQMTSDLKSSRAKIQRYSKTLEQLLKQKDEFIGQLGHDLKNPLQPLVGLLPIIMEQEKDPKLKEHLKLIVHNVTYMRDLIFETLELARLRSSNIKIDIKEINLKQEIDKILENQQLYLLENKMSVKNKVDSTLIVMADQLRFAELINNLVTNAVKYTPKDLGLIVIDAKKDESFVIVSFKDNGIGMTKDQINRIFDEFYMADESRRRVDSSGLGLAICKRIVEKHGGKIWVESPGKDKGSTFYFTLKIN
jgi:signal transduction histidine kinase